MTFLKLAAAGGASGYVIQCDSNLKEVPFYFCLCRLPWHLSILHEGAQLSFLQFLIQVSTVVATEEVKL